MDLGNRDASTLNTFAVVRYSVTSLLQRLIIQHLFATTYFSSTMFIVLIFLHTTTMTLCNRTFFRLDLSFNRVNYCA